jgi:hypothetical protein
MPRCNFGKKKKAYIRKQQTQGKETRLEVQNVKYKKDLPNLEEKKAYIKKQQT